MKPKAKPAPKTPKAPGEKMPMPMGKAKPADKKKC